LTVRLLDDLIYSVSAYLTVYASISAALVLLHFVAEFLYSLASITASRTTHNELLTRILGAKMSFFSDTPSGHITSCFSSDFSMFDRAVADSFSPVTTAFLGILTSIGVFLMLSRYYILALLPLSFIYGYIHSRYR
jgi:ABC-type multidrug transport system fused ATPase/permease subunit